MPPAGHEPTISAGERAQIYALDRTATRTGHTSGCTKLKSELHALHGINEEVTSAASSTEF
jgi:hypothetical protein